LTIMRLPSALFTLSASLLALSNHLAAAPAVHYAEGIKAWFLQTDHTTYVVGVNETGELQSIYWGSKLTREVDLTQAHLSPEWASFDSAQTTSNIEYPGWGGRQYLEPSLKVTLADGVRDLVLKYVDQTINGDTLQLKLKDIKYDLFVTLTYRAYPAEDVIRKTADIQNKTGQVVTIESAQSGVWYLPRGRRYRLTYAAGRWAGEDQLQQQEIQQGKVVLESRRGNTSHQLSPWFAIDQGGKADQETGNVWFGTLGWSGNWKLVVEDTPMHQIRVTGGYNDFDFSYPLKPGEHLETPAYYGGFSNAGFGGASRSLHHLELNEILPDHAHPHVRPVLYNSWEATEFNVNEAGQEVLAEKAARIGVERFVMDDGWFGARNNDHAGLGDWVVNRHKFPNGLQPLIKYVNGLGMDFGLWFEPEMVNPNSDLYRKHPDWALHFQGRPRTEARNQLVLNMARDDVRDYIFDAMDKVLNENNIKFIKWDMNRHFSEPGWPEVPIPEQKEVWVKYVQNVYWIMDRLRAKHPGLEIESCSGGGGRVDLGVMKRTDEVWTSDNTEAFDRLTIQEGFTYAFTPKVMMAWVTDVPNMNDRSTPLAYRFLVAMQGSLGIGANLNKWAEADFNLATKMIAYYKSIRKTVQEGNLYRLLSPRESDLTANDYVSRDGKQAVLFAFLHSQQFRSPMPAILLRGLDPDAVYRVKKIDNKLIDAHETYSGSYLMNHGVILKLVGDFDSTSVELERVN
jgi:alpha-galactosidase